MSTPPRAADVVADLAARRGQALMRLAFLLAGDAHEAEDLVQTTLTKLLVTGSIAEARAPFEYAKRSMTNEFLDRRRRRTRFARAQTLLVSELRPVPASDTCLVERDALLRAFAVLKPRERACIVLRFYEDWSDPEIATVLGYAPATVRSVIARALPRLRAALGRMDIEESGDGGHHER